MTASPVRIAADGVTVAVRLTPKAGRNGFAGLSAEEDGGPRLRARVTAAPEDGKANAALIRLLAKAWNLPKSSFSVAGGGKNRRKVIHVAGDPAVLRPRLDRWIRAHHG